MKAWFSKEYGSIDVLQFGEIQVPTAGPGHVLIKVRAAALNPVDRKMLEFGIFRTADAPFPMVLGCDLAGIVADVGKGVSKFKKGDEVYGDIQDFTVGSPMELGTVAEFTVGSPRELGTLAEFTVAEEHLLALKPSNLSFEEAASLPLVLLTALQAFDTVDFEKGQSVFIVGGAGGMGTLAIQLAKQVFEASRIVSTCSTGKVKFVKRLGADLVVDYTKQGYEQVDEKFDFFF